MKSLLLLAFYSLGLFLVSYFLLDMEGMLVDAFASQTEVEIPQDCFQREYSQLLKFFTYGK